MRPHAVPAHPNLPLTPAPFLAAVMVCQESSCASHGPATVDALRPLVARTPRAVLISTGCLHPHSTCPSSEGSPGSCGVRLQRCTEDLQALTTAVSVTGTPRVTYRLVQDWLDHLSSP